MEKKVEVKTMYNLKLNEELHLPEQNLTIVRVPGAWLYRYKGESAIRVKYDADFLKASQVQVKDLLEAKTKKEEAPVLDLDKPVSPAKISEIASITVNEKNDTIEVEKVLLPPTPIEGVIEFPKYNVSGTLTAQDKAELEVVEEEETELQRRIAVTTALNPNYKVTKDTVTLGGGVAVTFKSLETMPEGVFNSFIEKYQSLQKKVKKSIEVSKLESEAPKLDVPDLKDIEEPNLIDMIAEEEKNTVVDDDLRTKFDTLMALCKENNIAVGGLKFEDQTEETIAKMDELVKLKIAK